MDAYHRVTTEALPTPEDDDDEPEGTMGGWNISEELLNRELTEVERRTLPEGLIQFRDELIAARARKRRKKTRAAIERGPPFPGLNSYEATGIILSYSGYVDEITKLMKCLARKTDKYFKEELPHSLARHMQEWEPYVIKMIEFGFTWYAWNTTHDNPTYLKALPRYKRVKLCGINYKCVFNEGALSAIQLDLTNANPTPWIETGMSSNDEL